MATKRRTRADDVFDVICLYALENQGSTPTAAYIADQLGLSQQRVSYLMMRLELEGRITWLTRYTYKVDNSSWDPPPDAVI
jgi:DNA-binding MarR family transcriptional regulator